MIGNNKIGKKDSTLEGLNGLKMNDQCSYKGIKAFISRLIVDFTPDLA